MKQGSNYFKVGIFVHYHIGRWNDLSKECLHGELPR